MSLASALAKIANAGRRQPMMSAERNPATAPLFIVNPLTGERMDNLFSTHPATENRIAALQQMTGGTVSRRPASFDAPLQSEAGSPGPWSRAGMRRRGPWG